MIMSRPIAQNSIPIAKLVYDAFQDKQILCFNWVSNGVPQERTIKEDKFLELIQAWEKYNETSHT